VKRRPCPALPAMAKPPESKAVLAYTRTSRGAFRSGGLCQCIRIERRNQDDHDENSKSARDPRGDGDLRGAGFGARAFGLRQRRLASSQQANEVAGVLVSGPGSSLIQTGESSIIDNTTGAPNEHPNVRIADGATRTVNGVSTGNS